MLAPWAFTPFSGPSGFPTERRWRRSLNPRQAASGRAPCLIWSSTLAVVTQSPSTCCGPGRRRKAEPSIQVVSEAALPFSAAARQRDLLGPLPEGRRLRYRRSLHALAFPGDAPLALPLGAVAIIEPRWEREAARPNRTDGKHWRSVAEGALTSPSPPVAQFSAPCGAATALRERVGPRRFVRAVLPDSCAPCPFRARRARFVTLSDRGR